MYIESKVDFEKENPFLFLHPAFTFVVFTSKWWKIAFTFFSVFFLAVGQAKREREKKNPMLSRRRRARTNEKKVISEFPPFSLE